MRVVVYRCGQPAIEAAVRLVRRLQCPTGTFTTLFVGAPGDAPAVRCPTVPGWQWHCIVQSGDVIDGIVQMASYMATNLIVMSTDGRNGFLDALRGSHSERVLRLTPPKFSSTHMAVASWCRSTTVATPLGGPAIMPRPR